MVSLCFNCIECTIFKNILQMTQIVVVIDAFISIYCKSIVYEIECVLLIGTELQFAYTAVELQFNKKLTNTGLGVCLACLRP